MDGLQATWAAAIAGGTVRGVQAGSVTVAPDVKGLQASNLVTLARGKVQGVQSSGMVAVGLADFAGLQSAGVTAVDTGAVTGVQASGVFNWADRIEGLQSSTANYAGSVSGVQVAVVNVTGGDVQGAQFGLVNLARNVKGAQFGLVNLARTSDASVGLLSVVEDGTHDVELYATEFSLANAGLRLGGSRFYGLLVGGVQPGEREDVGEVRWTFGAGIGSRFDLGERFRLDVDVLGQNVQYGRPYDTDDGENVLGSLRATVAYRAAPWISVFAGPSLNVWAADEKNDDIDLGTDVGLWNDSRAWVGFAAGVRL
jgi:hypothetical protein